MKFEDKYPDMRYLEVDEGIIRGKKAVPCAICKEPTLFVDLCEEQPFCSEECMTIYYTNLIKIVKEQ